MKLGCAFGIDDIIIVSLPLIHIPMRVAEAMRENSEKKRGLSLTIGEKKTTTTRHTPVIDNDTKNRCCVLGVARFFPRSTRATNLSLFSVQMRWFVFCGTHRKQVCLEWQVPFAERNNCLEGAESSF
jgi:hypothetical protein